MTPKLNASRYRAVLSRGLALALIWCVSLPLMAEDSVEDRLARIERLLGNDTLLQMLDELRALRNEVRAMRGDVEVQAYNAEQAKTQAKQRYLDLDDRLKRLEAGLSIAADPLGTGGQLTDEGGVSVGDAQLAIGGGDPAAEEETYRAAFAELRAGRYGAAAAGFEAYGRDYPNGRFAANARYWLGETHYVEQRYAKALEVFNSLTAAYPASEKAPDAGLKSGYILLEQGKRSEGRRVLEDVASVYPNTRAAELARERLSQLGN